MEPGLFFFIYIFVGDMYISFFVGSGDLAVLATPVMISLMENAAMLAVADALSPGETTVGSEMSASHVRPTGVGDTVVAVARLVAVDGRRLEFEVEASDSRGVIGSGKHVRYIVGREKFMAKLG